MTALSRRQEPRIRFRAPLRIKEARTARAIEATSLDLSQGGIGVRAPSACEVGANVVCELELEGERVSLAGVVTWTDRPEPEATVVIADNAAVTQQQEPPRSERPDTKTQIRLGTDVTDEAPATRPARRKTRSLFRLGTELPSLEPSEAAETSMGIRFETLSSEHAQMLHGLVQNGEPVKSPVQLLFSGMAEPIRAQAETSPLAIRVLAPLPFLALDSAVRIGVTPESDEQTGCIQRVELVTTTEQRVPCLEIDIALDNGISHVRSVDPHAGSPQKKASNPRNVQTDSVRPATTARVPLLLAMLVTGAGLGAIATWFSVARPAREAAARAAPGLRTPSPLFAKPTAKPVLVGGPEAHESENPSTLASAATIPTQPEIATQPAPTATAPEPEPERAPEVADAPSPVVALAAPEVTVSSRETKIFLPMDGSDQDISRYELSSPGLVINLPHARPRIAFEDYSIYQGVVRRIWLREHHDGVQVRVTWRHAPLHSKVVFDERGLTLRIRL
jgi:hypothetical protein